MNSTSVRGSRTSRSCRFPASNTSATMRRSSADSAWCPTTRSCSSSAVITSRPADGSPPSSRTTTLVDMDNSQTSGLASTEIRSRSGAANSASDSGRCSASRLGASSCSTRLKNEMAAVTVTSESTDAQPELTLFAISADFMAAASVAAPNAPDSSVATVTPIWTADRKRLGSWASFAALAPPAPLRQRPDLALTQRDQSHLRAGEEPADEQNDQNDDDVPADLVHGLTPDLRSSPDRRRRAVIPARCPAAGRRKPHRRRPGAGRVHSLSSTAPPRVPRWPGRRLEWEGRRMTAAYSRIVPRRGES